MTSRDRPPSEWRFVDIRPSVDDRGRSAVTFRQGTASLTYFMSPDMAEDAAWRLLEAAKLARAGIGRTEPEGES